jgi:hypothetical protein
MNTSVSPPAAPSCPFDWFPRRRIFTLAALVTGVWLALRGPLVAAPDEATAVWTVPSTADQRSFTGEVVSRETRAGYQLLHLRFPSAVATAVPQNNRVPARLFLPDNLPPDTPRRPGVICLPILNGDEALTSAVCAVLVQRGIPALMFNLPYYGERGTTEGRRVYARDIQTLLEGLEKPSRHPACHRLACFAAGSGPAAPGNYGHQLRRHSRSDGGRIGRAIATGRPVAGRRRSANPDPGAP